MNKIFLFFLYLYFSHSVCFAMMGEEHREIVNEASLEHPSQRDIHKSDKKQSDELRSNLMTFKAESHRELNHIISYVAFGILIALFYMRGDFTRRNKGRVIVSGLMSVVVLVLNFLFTFRDKIRVSEIISSNNLNQDYISLYQAYISLLRASDCHFSAVAFLLLIGAVVFLWLSYTYLLDSKNK